MSNHDPILAALTSPGMPFEIGEVGNMRGFRRAPQNLDVMIESARRFGSATFVVEGETRLTYDDIFTRRDAIAAALDINPGDHVAIAMQNRAAWMIAFLAVIHAGGVAVLVNSRGVGSDMLKTIEQCDVALVLADETRANALREADYKGKILEASNFPTIGKFTRTIPPASPNHPAAILFTSGTTGHVKGAVLSHMNIITCMMSNQLAGLVIMEGMARQYDISVEKLLAGRPQMAVLLVYPLFHISGLGSGFLTPFFSGGKVVIMRRWDAEEAVQLMATEKVTTFAAVPTMLWDVLNCSRANEADLSSLTQVASGGQALPLNLLEAVRERFPKAFLGTGFGLTETSGAFALAMGDDFLRNSAASGRVLALAEVRTLDADGQPLGESEIGEIAVRGPMIMLGYWNDPAATEAVLSADGWFCTGDIGYVDKEGYIFIVDRKKDMVISGGENIYCAEIERILSHLPEVTESAAFGLPDQRLGERLVVVVVGNGLDESQVQEHVATKLARYKAPVRVGFSNEPLPRNATAKIDKIKLRSDWALRLGEK